MSKLAGKVAPFNPGIMTPENRKFLLVGREKETKIIVERIVKSAKEKSALPQQLLIGPRGYGKTHILHVINDQLIAKKTIQKKLVIALLKEEEHVHSYLDLLRRILETLKKNYKSKELNDILNQVYANPTANIIPLVEEVFNNFIGDRLLLVMVENLGDIFDGIGETGQKQLRAFLQESRKTSLFATAQRLFEPHTVRKFPFYGFFERTYLKPLNEAETHLLMIRVSELTGDRELSDFLRTDLGKARSAAVKELTGGNPRLIILLSGFLNKERLEELTEAFVEFVETSLTPYYQEQLGKMAPLRKRVVEILCEKGDGKALPVKEIARKALTTSQSISGQLKKMVELGILYSKKRGRESLYGMAEPLWRVSIEVKNHHEETLRIVVEFLKIIKTPGELFAKLSETDVELQCFQKHWAMALKESLSSLEDKERDKFQNERLMEICNNLSQAPDDAERVAKVLSDTGNDVGKVLWLTIRTVMGKEKPERLEPFIIGEDSDLKSQSKSVILMSVISIQGVLGATISPKCKKEKLNYLQIIRWTIMRFYLKNKDTSVLEDIDTASNIVMNGVLAQLIYENKKSAVDWLLKISNDLGKRKELIKAIREYFILKFKKTPFFDFLKRVNEKVLVEILPRTFAFMFFGFGKDNKNKQFLSILEKRLSIEHWEQIIFTTASSLISSKKFFDEVWEKDRMVMLESLEHVKVSEKFKILLVGAEAFAKGETDALADWPIEILKQFEKAKAKREKEY